MSLISPMSRPKAIALFVLLLGFAFIGRIGFADDFDSERARYWPQWRGPLSNGVAPHANPPIDWSETKNVKWKVTIPGEGGATPIVWGDRVFIQTAFRPDEDGKAPAIPAKNGTAARMREWLTADKSRPFRFVVMAFDRASGEVLWRQVAREERPHERHHKTNTYAPSSPVTDGERLYAYFGSQGLHAFDFDGNKLWERDFGKMETRLNFGEGSSPALHGDTIVVNWDHQGDSFVVAVDKRTGETIWKRKRDEATSWSTPLIVESEGPTQVIVSATKKTRSYDLATGRLIWECAGLTQNVIPTPVANHGAVFVMSGYRGKRLQAIELSFKGDLTDSVAILWSIKRATSYVPSPLLYGDNLYFIDTNKNIVSNVDARGGAPRYTQVRLTNLKEIYASPVGAAGRVYFTGRDGNFAVIKDGPEFELLAQNELDDRFDASPAIAGDEIFLRGMGSLYCIAEL